MRQNKLGKITASVTFEISQLERLNEIAHDSRVSRSTIVRDAIEHELERYDNALPSRKVERTRSPKHPKRLFAADTPLLRARRFADEFHLSRGAPTLPRVWPPIGHGSAPVVSSPRPRT
jgi:hypothetical protein